MDANTPLPCEEASVLYCDDKAYVAARSVVQTMTKTGVWHSAAACGLLLLTFVPLAAGHGAPSPREIDDRLLLDKDGMLAYSMCIGTQCPRAGQGLDVLALDVREAYLAGAPALVFRLMTQTDASTAGRGLELRLTTPAKEWTFQASATASGAYSSESFDLLTGPFNVGDGHPKALDGWIWYSTLGVEPGQQLTGISLRSTINGSADDIMPGTWMLQGTPVPYIPEPADASSPQPATTPATYTLHGPTELLTARSDQDQVHFQGIPVEVKVRLTSNVSTIAQFVALSLEASQGVTAALDADTLNLDGGGARDVVVTIRSATLNATLNLTVQSDLGGFQQVPIQIHAATPSEPHGEDGPQDSSGNDDRLLPPAPLPTLLLLLATLAILVRRTAKESP
jgi:hypothetical protein